MKPGEILELPPNRVWRSYLGGRELDSLQGLPEAADAHFPEDWIASCSRAVNKGREGVEGEGLSKFEADGRAWTLPEYLASAPEALLGAEHLAKHGAAPGFLLKLLDASIRLHVQVHPTAEFARAHLGSPSGKMEGYYILKTRPEEPEPCIYLGFKRKISREEFKRLILAQDIEGLVGCLNRIPVKAGDSFIVPGGVPHAIGPGTLMVELMEPTDFAARFEFERGGYVLPEASRFLGRGIDFALSMLNFEALPLEKLRERLFAKPQELERGEGFVISELLCPARGAKFHLRAIEAAKPCAVPAAGRFGAAIAIEGEGEIASANGTIKLKPGSRLLIPTGTEAMRFEKIAAPLKLALALPS